VERFLGVVRLLIAVIKDAANIAKGFVKNLFFGTNEKTEFTEFHRVLDDIESQTNGVAAANKKAAEEQEALAIQAERAAEAAAQQVQKYEERLQQLQIESVALSGNTELAREMQLAAEGYTAEQIATIAAMEQQNALIAERIKKEQEAAKEAEESRKKADQWLRDQEKKFADQINEVNREFDLEVKSAMKAAANYFDAERQRDQKMREDASAGPGAGIEAGSAQAAKFMADQVNQAIGAAAVPEKPTPGEAEIAAKTRELYIAQIAANTAQQEELKVQKDLLDEFRKNKFQRFRK
jgi:hypothetical protein